LLEQREKMRAQMHGRMGAMPETEKSAPEGQQEQ
jgi:hypothetical protein